MLGTMPMLTSIHAFCHERLIGTWSVSSSQLSDQYYFQFHGEHDQILYFQEELLFFSFNSLFVCILIIWES